MNDDEGRTGPKPVVSHVVGSDLASLSVDEIRDRVALLEAEIARLRAEESRKESSRAAAGAFFRV